MLEEEPNDLIVIQVYVPTLKTDEEIEEAYERIEELLNLTKGKDDVFIMCDWTTVIGENNDGRKVGNYGLGQKKRERRSISGVEQRKKICNYKYAFQRT